MRKMLLQEKFQFPRGSPVKNWNRASGCTGEPRRNEEFSSAPTGHPSTFWNSDRSHRSLTPIPAELIPQLHERRSTMLFFMRALAQPSESGRPGWRRSHAVV
jgi:hypothetical protein